MKQFTPYDYQKHCVQTILDKPFCGLFLDMGLGKTAITLSAIAELVACRFEVSKVLIVAPKKVAETTWQNEAEKWTDFSFLKISTIMGNAKQRTCAAMAAASVYIVSRDNIGWLVDLWTPERWPYDMVVLDESTSFKSHKTARFRALKRVRPKIARLVELTGTPSPNSIADLWAQIYLLDCGARLEKSFSAFRTRYFTEGARIGHIITSYEAKNGAEESITRAISDICVSMKSEDYLQLPDLITDDRVIVLDDKAQKAYDQMEKNMILEAPDKELISATSAAALSTKLLQVSSGAVYDADHGVHLIHDNKIEAFLEMIEALNGRHALVFYAFQHDRDRITEALKNSGLRVRTYSDQRDLRDWNAGDIDILLAHPASTAYGLNLQFGGHHIIWFSPTWNFELYTQANKRLHRQGQTEPVRVHRLIVKGTRDEDVIQALGRKDDAQEYVIDSLKARIRKYIN